MSQFERPKLSFPRLIKNNRWLPGTTHEHRSHYEKLILPTILSALVLINPLSASAILNGTAVSETEYRTSPVVAIYTVENKTAGRRCTGVLLNNTTILSAAHCFKNVNNLKVYIIRSTFLDIPGRNPVQNEFEINNNQVSLHQDYNAEKHMNDLAIIKLNQELPDTEGVTYPKFTKSLNVERFIFFGYGRDLNKKTGALNTVTKLGVSNLTQRITYPYATKTILAAQ